MPEFVKIGSRSDLPEEGEAKEFTVGNRVICVANIAGAYSAVDNACIHRGGPLGQGIVMDGKLICPWHGWRYDVSTGIPMENPNLKVDVHRLRIDGDEVFVEI